MNYVMSDIHGEYDMFIEMLEKINFSKDDTLYILGDIIDRGKQNVDIIDYIVTNPNIHLLLGNHEQLFIDFIESENRDCSWLQCGGFSTYQEFTQKGSLYLEQVFLYFKKLPYIKVVDKFILVHAGLNINNEQTLEELIANQEKDNVIWDRSKIGKEKTFKDYTIICGHTPVQCIKKQKDTILKQNGTIYIDCGAPFENGQLSCINLDTMEEYYIKHKKKEK